MKGLIVFTLCLLIAYGQGNVPAQAKDNSRGRSIDTIADGSVTDNNFDGFGDGILDGENSVVVGFNSFGPGEHRGIYEFDVSRIRNIPDNKQVILHFTYLGRHMDWTDYDLTFYACQGDGVLDLSDFTCDRFVTAFNAMVAGPPYDILIDVTSAVRQIVLQGDPYIAFVIRPNPSTRNQTGALLFNSTEITANYDVPPAKLTIRSKK